MASEPPGDLLGTQVCAQQILDHAPLLPSELAMLATAAPTPVGGFLRTRGPVAAVDVCGVAPELAINRAAIPAQQPGNLFVRKRWRLLSQRGQRIPLFGSDLVITHDDTFLPEDFVSVPDRPFSRERVLHLLLEFAAPNFGVKLARPGFGPPAEPAAFSPA